MSTPKLTKPQRELLREIGAKRMELHPSYPPAVKLVTLGLAVWSGRFQNVLVSTAAGHALTTAEETNLDQP